MLRINRPGTQHHGEIVEIARQPASAWSPFVVRFATKPQYLGGTWSEDGGRTWLHGVDEAHLEGGR
jgi:hypothetical protein